jgi:tetratricopeptide (TPR) repeat protein
MGNWHPLTWLSHMLDVELFGLAPAGHHAVNVALHALDAALLFVVLGAATGRPRRSFVVAALFAVHPVQVESVAWIAERKNLLSTSFGLLALGAYVSYARHGGALRWTAVASAMAASLLAKAMFVTLPFVLLLLDVWPLKRYRTTSLARLLAEKLPLLAISALASFVAYRVQSGAGAMTSSLVLPWALRVAYAPIAYVQHLQHLLWPSDLAVLYPHPLLAENAVLAVEHVLLASGVLAAVTGLAILAHRRGHAAPLFGWLFFLGTLVPVIGIVQIGNQALADRYAYVPSIGLFVAVVWGGAGLLRAVMAEPRRRAAALLVTAGVCAVLTVATRAQMAHWRDSRALFERAIAVTGPNPVMQHELGVNLSRAGATAVALPHFEQAVALAPYWALALQNFAGALAELGHPERALPYVERAVALEPENAHAVALLGLTLLRLDRDDEGLEQLARAVRLEPSATFLELLAAAEARAGRLDEAIAAQRRAVAAAGEAGSPERARLAARLEELEQQQEGVAPPARPPRDADARPQLVAPTRGPARKER